jgi:hypothetical protein
MNEKIKVIGISLIIICNIVMVSIMGWNTVVDTFFAFIWGILEILGDLFISWIEAVLGSFVDYGTAEPIIMIMLVMVITLLVLNRPMN